MSEQQEFLDTILEEFRAIVNRHFPDFINSGYGYAGPQFHITLSNQADSIERTPYYYSDELKFVHWTSIDNLVSIINNREIRLYNLINSDDEQKEVLTMGINIGYVTKNKISELKIKRRLPKVEIKKEIKSYLR